MTNITDLINRAASALNKGDFAETERLCLQILADKRNVFEAFYFLARAQAKLGRHVEALVSYERALALQPNNAQLLSDRGNTLFALKRPDEALESHDRAIAAQPDYAIAHNNRGDVLNKFGRSEEALASFERALALQPNLSSVQYNRGNVQRSLARFHEALASYDRAIALSPEYVSAHWNRALTWLLLADFERGWLEYEWRLKTPSNSWQSSLSTQPPWRGEAIDGKTILLHGEQGFGDSIQFYRYIPMVAARGARVVLAVQTPLLRLMAKQPGALQVVGPDGALPLFDCHCPLMSLPLAFGTRLETVPSATPYLEAPPDAVQDWATRLGPKRRLRVGLAWSGRATHKDDPNRSVKLNSMLPLLAEVNAEFISLQKDVRPEDAGVLATRTDICHFGDALKDFVDTAALISQLDLVISVDTSVAHLAGALGKPVWILLPFVPDWRWMRERDDSPWYPSTRLFRQDATKDWALVIARVHGALCELVQNRH
jgi:tetratricopeptide (TPR) repeat protein